ncbi:hypothetical protein ACIP25_07210 [Streptomyces massasporeus]|uniref:hypothetical protein n=1 Tax=Streptomyces massasporeus TaxID=67324 RepID=UPI0036882746
MATVEPKAVHGMLVLGEEIPYLSHLPMFMSPHDVQALLEVTFDNETHDAHQVYAEDRRTTGTDVYTLSPERFRLSDLAGVGGQPGLTSFTGTLFRGHFERGGTEIVDPVTVTVRRLVHFRRFDHHAERPAALTYVAFGKGRELFLAHLINLPPDFDQAISVRQFRTVSGGPLTDELLATGPQLKIVGREDRAGDRLREGEQVAASFLGGGSGGVDLRLSMGREFYEEEGELAAGHAVHAH